MSENEPTPDEATAPDVFKAALAALTAKTAASKEVDKTYAAAQKVWEEIQTARYGTSAGGGLARRSIGLIRRYGPWVAGLGGGGSIAGSIVTALSADDGGFGDVTSLVAVIGQLFGGGAP